MMRSMFSGVAGLRVHQTRMDVIGNNIANVNTIGYKSQRVTFNDVFSQTLQSASSSNDETGRGGLNPMQVGLGVNISSIDMLMTQGAAQRTDNPFDLMINGEGFIVVGDSSGKYFTRAGALRQDDDGNLIIPNGMKVQGWTEVNTNATTGVQKIVAGEVKPIKLNDPATKTTKPEASKAALISGNINSTDTKAVTQIKFYDSLGNYYNLNLNVTQTATAGTWTAALDATPTVTDQNGNKFTIATTLAPTSLVFNTAGKLITPTDGNITLTGITLSAPPTGVNLPASVFNTITVNASTVTQYAAKTNLDSKAIDGKAAGKIMGYDVGADGIITASYDNGDSRLIGQIVVAQFDNPAGLEKTGDNLYSATTNSGDFNNVGKVGNFQAGVLEMSNVDLAKEFTEMIITQRGFQANSKIITVSDEMLQELTNLKR